MFLSKAELSRGAGAMAAWASALKVAADSDMGHKLVWTLFARDADQKRTFLWRQIEPGSYLILSQDEPQDETRLWRIQSKAFEPDLKTGDRLAFSLRANPAMSIRVAGQRGKRTDPVMHAKRPAKERDDKGLTVLDALEREKAALDWLFKREERLGVTFDRDRCSAPAYDVVKAGRSANGGAISFALVDYEGVLVVREPTAFQANLFAGIGKAKAYGCGLMLIRRT
jgi:CRISPR system Cascade subunit CasE